MTFHSKSASGVKPDGLAPVAKSVRAFFSGRRRFGSALVVIVLLVAVASFVVRDVLRAATYTWTQASWAGGATATTAVHPTNQTGWTEYSAKDATISAGASVVLQPETLLLGDSTDTNFNAGTYSGTALAGAGLSGQVELSQSEGSTPVESTYTSGGLTMPFNTIDPDGNLWAVTNGSPYAIHKVTPGLIGSSFSNTCANGNSPAGIAYDPVTPAVWVTNGTDRRVCRFNPSTGAELGETTIGGAGNLGRLAYDPVNQNMWVVNYTYGYLYRLDLSANVLNTYDLPTLTGLSGGGYNLLVYEPTTASLFSAVYDGDTDSNSIVKVVAGTGTTTSTPISYVGTGLAVMAAVPTAPAVWILDPNYGSYRINANTLAANVFNPGTSPTTITYDGSHDVVWTTHSVQPYLKKWSIAGASLNTYTTANRGNSFDASYDPVRKRLWSTRGGSGSGIWSVSFVSYGSSGTFSSRVLDTAVNQSFGVATWTESVPTNTALTIKARTSNSPTMVGAPDFSTCAVLTSGQDINDPTCVIDGQRYLQYQAEFSTSNASFSSALLDITFQYQAYTSGTLTSSVYDAGDATNVVSKVAWSQSGTGTVQFQIRTSPDNAAWTDWLGPTGTGDYYTASDGSQTVNPTQTDGSSDRYIQWRANLISSDGQTTPTLSGVTITYVVNAAPEFESAPTAVQGSDGLVAITYSIRDTDTSSGSTTRGFVTPTYEYSINNGGDWNSITTGLSAGATDNKAVEESDYTQYVVTWNAKVQIDGTYAAQAKVRVRINDNEGANNIALGTSGAFDLDVKDPVLGSPAVSVDATSVPAAVSLNASDDSALEMCITLTNTETNCASYNSSTTIALATNPDTVYAIFQDARGNQASANAVTPETPQNMIIRDLSNLDANQYFLFVSWKSVSTPLPQFGSYQVWHSTDGATYELLQSINDRSINYFLHQGLADDSLHYYKVATTDVDGNRSYFSTTVSDTVNGQGGTDSTTPTISTVNTSQLTTQSATITWETDELSDSMVGFSSTPGNFDTEVGVATMVDNAAGVGAHSVVLTGLTPNTTYYFRVQSTDPSDNTATSDNGGDGYSFMTTAGPSISNVTFSSIENTQATIVWKTNVAADSTVVYSESAALASPLTANDSAEVTDHSLTLTNLTAGTRYYFKVQSGLATDTNGGDYYSFVTSTDATPPVITGLTADPVTDTEAVIQWQTNEKATSKVFYGTSHGTFSLETPIDSVFNLSHAVTLKNLLPDTTYHVVVESVDAAGNPASSTEYDFTTREELSEESEVVERENEARNSGDTTPPVITDIAVEVTNDAAEVSWQTDEPANSFVEFGPVGGDADVHGHWIFLTGHQMTLSPLNASTSYTYRVVSVDENGNLAASQAATFTTARLSSADLEARLESDYDRLRREGQDVPTPVIGGEPRVEATATTATITWTTDKSSNGLVAYASQAAYQPERSEPYTLVVGDPERYSLRHQMTLVNLEPDTVYHFQIRSRTTVSPAAVTRDATFRTQRRTFAIENYVIEKSNENEAIFRWITNEDAVSVVKYIPYRGNIRAVDEVQQVRVDAYTTIHQVTVSNFEPDVRYDIELISLSRDGTLATREIGTFSTEVVATPPSISGVEVDTALSAGENVKVQTIFSWSTNKPATGRVLYREGVSRNDEPLTDASPLDTNYTKKHVIVLTTLKPGTVYQYRIESTDSEGQVSLSKPMTILTPQQQRTVFQVILDTVQQTFGWTSLFK